MELFFVLTATDSPTAIVTVTQRRCCLQERPMKSSLLSRILRIQQVPNVTPVRTHKLGIFALPVSSSFGRVLPFYYSILADSSGRSRVQEGGGRLVVSRTRPLGRSDRVVSD